MSDRLPPLTALRAFEAAARHMSFARAADELNVTPAALSFQIKSLETHLGQPVFRRLNRAVELTEAGKALFPGASEGFRTLTAAWSSVRRLNDNATLTVPAGPSFTAKWLAPRLYDFARAHPEIELRLSAGVRVMDFDRDDIDVAIRFGLTSDDGLYSLPIIREWLTPMMTPELAAQVKEPKDLLKLPFIHDEMTDYMRPRTDWSTWFQVAGLDAPVPQAGPRFNQADHAVDAASAGSGVLLGRISITHTELRLGKLVGPIPIGLASPAQFRLLCPLGSETRPQIAAFRDWIKSETAGLESLSQGFEVVDPPR